MAVDLLNLMNVTRIQISIVEEPRIPENGTLLHGELVEESSSTLHSGPRPR